MAADPSPPQPLVSIGIPTYNRPNELRSALTQILGQTYRNLEVIVSDNASPGTAVSDVVKSFMTNDHRLRYFRQETNFGPVKNFQFVLEQATGDYYMWCADDDWHAPEFVETLAGELNRRPDVALAFCDLNALDAAGNVDPCYENFFADIQRVAVPRRNGRRWRYYLLDEWGGKPVPIYGLMRRHILQGFSFAAFVAKHGEPYVDNLFVDWLLSITQPIFVNRKLFGIQVGNVKYHGGTDSSSAFFLKLKHWIHYLVQCVRVVPWWQKPFFTIAAIYKSIRLAITYIKIRT